MYLWLPAAFSYKQIESWCPVQLRDIKRFRRDCSLWTLTHFICIDFSLVRGHLLYLPAQNRATLCPNELWMFEQVHNICFVSSQHVLGMWKSTHGECRPDKSCLYTFEFQLPSFTPRQMVSFTWIANVRTANGWNHVRSPLVTSACIITKVRSEKLGHICSLKIVLTELGVILSKSSLVQFGISTNWGCRAMETGPACSGMPACNASGNESC